MANSSQFWSWNQSGGHFTALLFRVLFWKVPKIRPINFMSIEETPPILEPLTTCFCKQISVWKYIVYSSWTNWDIEMQNKKMSILRLQNRMVCNWSIPTRQYENQTRPRLQTKKNNFREFTFKQIPEETETVKNTELYFSEQF